MKDIKDKHDDSCCPDYSDSCCGGCSDCSGNCCAEEAEEQLKDKKVAVLGLGVEGVSSVKFLLQRRAKVTVLDRKEEKEIDEEILKKVQNPGLVKLKLGNDYLKDLQTYDLIIRSPGVKIKTKELEEIKEKKEITSQTRLFFDLCPCPIIGVTGTKGKGTTCSLIYEMLKKQGKDAYLGGNIGQPPLDFLDKLNTCSIVVLELSSFQLQDLEKNPHIAVVLMITSEHLDYHNDISEYVEAKRNILRFQNASDAAIINKDYPASNESDIHTNAKVFYVSRERECEEGCFVRDGKVIVHRTKQNLEQNQSEFSLVQHAVQFSSAINDEEIIHTKDILLPGKHNLENVCAAVMAAKLAGVSTSSIVHVLKTFKGLEHRLELVAEVKGVKYYDDSFSTTPETAIAAIEAFKNPKIIILGGSGKGSDFSELGKIISESDSIKAIIGVGPEWHRIKKELRIKNYEARIIEGCKNMQEIVQKAAEIAKPGDIVLLSPACASFDMFKNYKDRGDQFKKEVRKLNPK